MNLNLESVATRLEAFAWGTERRSLELSKIASHIPADQQQTILRMASEERALSEHLMALSKELRSQR